MNAFSQTQPNQHSINVDALKRLFGKLGTYAAEISRRRKIKAGLSKLSEQRLRDIGLTSNDVLSAVVLPVFSDGAEVLTAMGKSRAGNW